MLLNRLTSLNFLPTATSGASGAASGADGAQPAEVSAKRVLAADTAVPLDNAAAPAQESVLLHLDSSRKTASTGTYTKDGLFADLPRTTPLTPAEEFVAAAVVNLRNYDQAKTNAIIDAAAKLAAQAAATAQGRFDGIKQAVSKLYAST